jgi:hypothetical protein
VGFGIVAKLHKMYYDCLNQHDATTNDMNLSKRSSLLLVYEMIHGLLVTLARSQLNKFKSNAAELSICGAEYVMLAPCINR